MCQELSLLKSSLNCSKFRTLPMQSNVVVLVPLGPLLTDAAI